MLLNAAPALCFLAGSLIWFAAAASRVANPDAPQRSALSSLGMIAVLLISAALALYGILFLRDPTPDWVGYLLLACAAALTPGVGLRILPRSAFYLEFVLAGFAFLLT